MNLISLLVFILTFNAFALTQDEEKKYDELEGLAFIQALSQDKKFDEVVKQFKAASGNMSEQGRLHFYLGDAYFQLKNYAKSYETLKKGEKFQKPASDYVKLWAQAASALKKYDTCSALYGRLKAQEINGAHWSTYYRCLTKDDSKEKALALSLKHKTRDIDFILESQALLVASGLQLNAEDKRREFLTQCGEVNNYIRLWDRLEKVKLRDMRVLEAAHACHPHAIEITSLFVKNLFIDGQYHSIAYLFQDLSVNEKEYIKHAAEFYKVAGRSPIADYFFYLGDEESYILNRSALLLNNENYAGLLTIPFKRKTLKGNNDLTYALAYSQFKFLSLDASEAILMAQSKKSGKDQQLEGLIEKCRQLGWRCRP